jgi:hypothetical protein
MIGQWLHAIGLSLGIVGVLILCASLLRRDRYRHIIIVIQSDNEDAKQRRRRYWFLSGVALGLACVVFLAR